MRAWYESRIFPHVLNTATRPLYPARRALLEHARGRVLELGVGTGANFEHYPAAASEIVGIEPVASMLALAAQRAGSRDDARRFRLVGAPAEQLPFADHSFDTVIGCLVFCTVADPVTAANEAFRVLKPGGQLLLMEHVASEQPGRLRLQRWLNPLWRPLACGCEIHRDTGQVLAQAGFDLDAVKRWHHPRLAPPMRELLYGSAMRPGG
ncbi:class I SAM-dependent methyltransferase [Isoalcanivorax beigongshangi]|uniref:Class I SAM-dependent methyltransferase n=1 Tax=Isoalcanivorax beigongshangi TaxID=3238810 RepID=A0ABV4AHW2_9GAMM